MINSFPGISVIICCYNSSLRLPETIRHLAEQKFSTPIPWEMVIVDNNSTDDTKEVALREWSKYDVNIPFIIVEEKLKGQAKARIKGIEASKFDYILYCDDDNWLFPDYLERAYHILEDHKNVAACGGYGIPVFENNEKPEWFDRFQGSYAVGPQLPYDGILPQNLLFGAGFTFKRHVHNQLKEAGLKKILSGRQEGKLTSGDDYEMSVQFKILGYDLYYDSNLKYYHYIPAFRFDNAYVIRLFKAFGEASAVTIFYDYAVRLDKITSYYYFKQLIKVSYNTCKSFVLFRGFDKQIHTSFNISNLKYLLNNRKFIFLMINNMNQIKAGLIKSNDSDPNFSMKKSKIAEINSTNFPLENKPL